MRKNIARVMKAALSFVLVLGLLPAPAFAEAGSSFSPSAADGLSASFGEDASGRLDVARGISAQATPDQGTIGGCTWAIDADGKLTIAPMTAEAADAAGTTPGVLPSNGSSSTSYWPWLRSDSKGSISSASIERGVSLEGSAAYMFKGCGSMWEIDVSGFDTSKVVSLHGLFEDCNNLDKIDCSSFDTSSVTDMGAMFSRCIYTGEIDVSSFDTSRVEDMSFLFNACNHVTSLNVSNFSTSSVKDMNNMFGACRSLASLDVSNFDTSSVTRMDGMFSGCASLTALDLSAFDTSSVTNMGYLFSQCSALASVNLSSFTTSAVTMTHYMFWRCNALSEIDLSNFDLSSVTSMSKMLEGCTALSTLKLGAKTTLLEDCGLKSGSWANRLDGSVLSEADLVTASASAAGAAGTWVLAVDSPSTPAEPPSTPADPPSTPADPVSTTDPVSIAGAMVMLSSESFAYDGTQKRPGVTVRLGGKTLSAGTDYAASYRRGGALTSDLASVGTVEVVVEGKDAYAGTVSKTFVINRTSVNDAKLTLVEASYTYDGTAKKPPVAVALGGRTLVQGRDYTVAYSGNVNAGVATVTVIGKGNYFGEAKVTFGIARASIASFAVALSTASYTWSGKAKKPGVTVTASSSQITAQGFAPQASGQVKLVEGRDYAVSYSSNVEPGTARVTVTGKGNYAGSAKKSFKILKRGNSLKAKGRTAKVGRSKLQKGKATVKRSSALAVSGAKGKVTYRKLSGSRALSVTSAGKVVVAKGTAKGTYRAKVRVAAAGDRHYKAMKKTVTLIVRVT